MVGLVALAVSDARPSHGCSVDRILSAEELTSAATVIVRAQAKEHIPPKSEHDAGRVIFQVLDTLKGKWGSPSFLSYGRLVADHDPNDHPVPYNFVRPAGRHGSCFAYEYRRGSEYLLFLREGDVQWAALAPINEEVSGPADPWVSWVRTHIQKR